MADKMSKLVLPITNVTTGEVTNKEFDVGGGRNTFVGTTAEWEALTTEQQNTYDCRVLTDDDLDTKNVIDNLTSDSSTDALSAKQGKVLKGLVDKAQGQVSNSDDAYDPTKAYEVGELCIYNNVLYRCTIACSAGSWATNQSCFTADTLVNVANTQNNNSTGYINVNDLITTLSTQGASYTMTKNGWVKANVKTTDLLSAQVLVDSTIVCANSAPSSAVGTEIISIFPAKKGQIISTRANTGEYMIRIYGCL